MSYKFIDQFLGHLYKIVKQIDAIKYGSVKEVYLNVNNREEFPCIYIITRSVEDKSRFNQNIYHIEFEISAYARQQGHQFLTNLAAEIKEVITEKNCSFDSYEIVGIANNLINFEQARDLVSNKLTMIYKAMIIRR